MDKAESEECQSQQTDSFSLDVAEIEPVPLSKPSSVLLDRDGQSVQRTRSETQGYEMETEVNKTVSADDLCPMNNLELADPGDVHIDMSQQVMGSFVEAVHRKYSDIGQLEHCFLGGLVLPKCSAVKVTESGNMLLPHQVSMSGCEISVAGNTDLIRRMCQKVTHLDLMANHIRHWDEVLSILECIPTLTFLNLSKNHIAPPLPDLSGRGLPCLTHLVLNDTTIQWDVLLQLLAVCPQIEELHLSLNAFTSIDIPDTPVPSPSVQKLFFIGNHVTDWQEINKLGRLFPRLASLMLCETEITSLGVKEDLGPSFPALQVLSLNRSRLNSWDEIEKLDQFPCLTDVRLNNIPFFETFPTKHRRHRQIASLPKMTMLNKSPVGEDEREDAERAFIRLFMDEEERPLRYYELVSKHGSVAPLATVDLSAKDTVKIKIIVEEVDEENIPSDNDDDNRPGVVMDLDVHLTLKALRKMLTNHARHPASKLTLFHRIKGCNQGPFKMIYQERKLLGYRMSDGDDIIVVKRP